MPNQLQFAAFRNGDEIGTCVYSFEKHGRELEVEIAVKIVVRLFGIPVYRFTHHSSETWRDDRLIRLASITDDNGTRHRVEADTAGEDRIALTADGTGRAIPGAAMPISFWQIAALTAPLLFDPVDGRVIMVQVEDLGKTTFATPGGAISAHGYRLSGTAGYRREMWYDAHKRLTRFVISAPDGSEIEYRLAQRI